VRTPLTFLDFAVGTAFVSIPLTLDYEGTVSCRAVVFLLHQMTFEKARLVNFRLVGETSRG
jgi:hypothetical protein